MARGKQTSYEDMVNIFVSYAATGNVTQTANDLGIPRKTVEGVIKKHSQEQEFAEILHKNKKRFADKAKVIIDKGMYLLDKRFDRAINKEGELDLLLSEIEEDRELVDSVKNKIVALLRNMQMYSIKDLTLAIAMLYDKKAIAEGKSTEISEINIRLGDSAEES